MKFFLLCLTLLSVVFCYSQEDAWVYFNDKPDTDFYLSNPLEMLSQKALDRREKQNIALDDKDVPIAVSYIDGVSASEGITVLAKSKWLNAVHSRGSIESINSLKNLSFVNRIDFADRSLNPAGRIAMPQQAPAVLKVTGTQAEFNYGNSANQIEMLGGQLLHQQNFTGEGMTIAVLDAGFPNVNTTAPFKRLRDNNQIKGGYNFVNRTDDFYTGGTHGTMVLSTIGGYVSGSLVGTAPDASYYLFITEDVAGENPVEESYWVEAAEMADSLGVDVINTSLGYFIYDNVRYNHTYEEMNGQTAFISRGANIAFSKGIFCVVSAGNSGATANPYISVPADALGVLTVGSVDANRNYSSFSSIGPSIDGRVKPDVMAKGTFATIATVDGEIGANNGTSFSSPIISGLVACLWQALPDKTNAELMDIIRQSADRYAAPTAQYGYGIPNFNVALKKGWGETINESIFAVYPNPAGDAVFFVFPDRVSSARVYIFNSIGQKVIESTVSSLDISVDISNLSQGVYSYKIEGAGLRKKGKILKQ